MDKNAIQLKYKIIPNTLNELITAISQKYSFNNGSISLNHISFKVSTLLFPLLLLYFVFNVASSTDKLLFWKPYNRSWYIWYVCSNSLSSDTK